MNCRRLQRAVPLVAALATAVLSPTTASALTYDNTDPSATGCSSDAFTWTSATVDDKFGYGSLGTLELRWSRSCQTGWPRFTPGSIWPTNLGVTVTRPADSATASASAPRYNTDWPFYGPQLNGVANCLEVRASGNADGPFGAIVASGFIPCAGGPGAAGSYAETTGGTANTWTDYTTAAGTQGWTIGPNATIYVTCKVRGFRVANGNAWWYRLASGPWNGTYYASADAFYNNGRISGSLAGTPYVDTNVRDC